MEYFRQVEENDFVYINQNLTSGDLIEDFKVTKVYLNIESKEIIKILGMIMLFILLVGFLHWDLI